MKYRATVPVQMMRGHLVGLTEEQARRRRSLVCALPVRPGWFEVVTPFEFKAGETFETDREMSKAEEHLVVEAPTEAVDAVVEVSAEKSGSALHARARRSRKG